MPDAAPVVVRACRPDEYPAYFEAFADAFGVDLDQDIRDDIARQAGPDRLLAAFVADGRFGGAAGGETGGETLAGVTCASPTTLTVPGGEVSAAAIAGVGVRPTHRRRGVLTTMMRRQLDDERRAGTVAAVLWASEPGIYGRYGFGLATWRVVTEIEPGRARFRAASPPAGRG